MRFWETSYQPLPQQSSIMAFALTQHVALSEKLVLALRAGVGGTLKLRFLGLNG